MSALIFTRPGRLLAGVLLAGAVLGGAAEAQYFKPTQSDLDASIMQIDEKKFLGSSLDGKIPLVLSSGKEALLSDFLGKPLIVVFSYYSCDGSCSVINSLLDDLLKDVKRVKLGSDYRILTMSFDRQDNLETTRAFATKMEQSEQYKKNWALATFKHEADMKAQTAKVGFKFFWSPQDKLFLHPGAFLFFSPKGRLIRILYPPQVDAKDVELAVLDAKQGQFRPQEIINFAISLCYSYNYEEGKYTLSIPVFVGFGALGFGITTLFGSLAIYRRKQRKTRLEGDIDNAKTT